MPTALVALGLTNFQKPGCDRVVRSAAMRGEIFSSNEKGRPGGPAPETRP